MVLALAVGIFPSQSKADNHQWGECWKASNNAYQLIPHLFYSNQPDSLLGELMAWEDVCGDSEPLVRIKILASIWDGAFDESIYNSQIIDYLIWRYDPQRQSKVLGEVDPSMASGDVASAADFAFYTAEFDTFSMELADQILPHTEPKSIEQFYCLFYSGQVDAAFELLHGQELAGTELRWYYSREMQSLDKSRTRPVFALTGGTWSPKGELLFVGDHAQYGGTLGIRQERWLGRLVLDVRPGRTDYPYFVDEEGISGRSDRWDNVYLGLEIGRELVKYKGHRVDAFVGLGFDGVKPFWDEKLILGTVNANAGVGYRYFLGDIEQWVVGIDYRIESIGVRNSGGTSLSGKADTLRFSLGYSPDFGRGRRKSGLGH